MKPKNATEAIGDSRGDRIDKEDLRGSGIDRLVW